MDILYMSFLVRKLFNNIDTMLSVIYTSLFGLEVYAAWIVLKESFLGVFLRFLTMFSIMNRSVR